MDTLLKYQYILSDLNTSWMVLIARVSNPLAHVHCYLSVMNQMVLYFQRTYLVVRTGLEPVLVSIKRHYS